jgi:glycolate oxidase
MKERLIEIFGADRVMFEDKELAPYREDYTEVAAQMPAAVVFATKSEEIVALVQLAREQKIPLTARVAGTNVGGLAIPAAGGIIIDFTRMNRIIEVNTADMYAVIEPGVTQQQLNDYLEARQLPLTFGFSLGPKRSSILANCLLDGLTNRSLKYGSQSEWISGLEAILADGSCVKTGAWALGDCPFGLVPFPDITGLFVGWQGTTGIVTKLVFQLWPKHPYNRRLFILAYSTAGTYQAVMDLCRTELCDDIGAMSWPTGKMVMGVAYPDPIPDIHEPIFFLYVDITGETRTEIRYKEQMIGRIIKRLKKQGHKFEAPLDIQTVVKVNPKLIKFAEFPTDLDFLTDHGGGGLTWVGTYGPLSRFAATGEKAMAMMQAAGFPPTVVSRPMRGGHFGVLRFVTIFNKQDQDEIARVKVLNQKLLELLLADGFIMYKTPQWALDTMLPQMQDGMKNMIRQVKTMLDPAGIMNPGKWVV